jgi:hypothetical protein
MRHGIEEQREDEEGERELRASVDSEEKVSAVDLRAMTLSRQVRTHL